MSKFAQLNLHPLILKALVKKGYETPTPIQSQAIPHLMESKDLLGIAQTGTGKTAAFTLPLIHHRLVKPSSTQAKRVQVLILTPTRELANQIKENIEIYAAGSPLKTAVVYGGVGYSPQVKKLAKGLHFLVATPGRLLDLMNNKHVVLDQVQTFVLDEADRMLDMGFINDIKKIIKTLPKKRQTLLFSATMPKSINDLAVGMLDNPIKVEVTPESTTVEKIDQQLLMVDKKDKPRVLLEVLKDKAVTSLLVFSRTKHGADRIVKSLDKNSIRAAAIHGNKSQNARQRALADFSNGRVRVLVATDIAARGIDVQGISHVLNFNLPEDAESYVHRIGRTARAGLSGIAISFCDESEVSLLKGVEKCIQAKIPVKKDHAFHREFSLQVVKDKSKSGRKGKNARKPKNKKGFRPF